MLDTNNLVSWSSKKQLTVARSSTESECRSVADVVAELQWIKAMLKELGYSISGPMVVSCDNTRAVFCQVIQH